MNQQRSEGWHEERRGMLTASRFGDVLARKDSKRYKLYQQQIVLELSGAPRFDDDAPWFTHGNDNEAEGLGAYAFENSVEVIESGFIVHPLFPYIGCSPDGLVNPNGGAELKCRSSLPAHLKTIKHGIDSQYKPQVQGCMWVTEREWWDFLSYYVPNRFNGGTADLHVFRVYRDDKYINKLAARCQEFWEEIDNAGQKDS